MSCPGPVRLSLIKEVFDHWRPPRGGGVKMGTSRVVATALDTCWPPVLPPALVAQ